MEYPRLGNSGLRVSRIALGCMSFGDPSRGFSEWSLSLLADQGVGSIPYSPLAKGCVCRPWGERSARVDHDPVGKRFDIDIDADAPIVDAVARVAGARGVPMAQVALAWVLRNPAVTAPIVGATKPHHLADAVAALALDLTDDEVRALEQHYVPHVPSGF